MRILETNQQTEPISSDCKYSLSCNPPKIFCRISALISTASNNNNNNNNNNIVEPFALPWLQFYEHSSIVFTFDLAPSVFFYLNIVVVLLALDGFKNLKI
jgi:hypothetical protein